MTFLHLIARAYVCHLLVFAAGAIAGAIEAFAVLAALWHAGICR